MSDIDFFKANEAAIFCGCFTDDGGEPAMSEKSEGHNRVSDLVSSTRLGAWEKVLTDSICVHLLKDVLDKHCFDVFAFENSTDNDCQLLLVAVSSIQAFIQLNYTGPCAIGDPSFGIGGALGDTAVQQLNALALECLSVDGETVYERTVNPFLLALGECLLLSGCRLHPSVGNDGIPKEAMSELISGPGAKMNFLLRNCLTWPLWTLRALMIHQQILDEKCYSLKIKVKDLLKAVADSPDHQRLLEPQEQSNVGPLVAVQFYLDTFRACSCYYLHEGIESNLKKACQAAGITIQYIGVQGKRTRYQEKDVSQLRIDVQPLNPMKQTVLPAVLSGHRMPTDVALNDDTVLENVAVSSKEQWSVSSLNPEQQAVVLATCENNMAVKADCADIVNEETLAHLSYLLAKPQNWCVQAKSLAIRSSTESDSSRRAERSLNQLEVLASLCQNKEPSATARLPLVFCTAFPPAWKMEQRLADYQVKIGAYSSALEVYERLGFWEEMVNCCHRIGRRQKAEHIVREQLHVKETPLLYCCLADATDNLDYYHKAWDMSNHKFARAARGLGFAHLRRGEFQDAVKYFEQALEINALHLGAWFSCGCAAMAAAEYQKAARCFHRCVSIDSDNFEAWNNLAAAYVRSQQKQRALAVLEDAIKCNYENWRVWENYLVVATDCGAFDAVIKAAHRLLDLKDKWSDPQVLAILCRAVLGNYNDMNGHPSQCYKAELLQLLGRYTAKVTPDGDTWCFYAQLLLTGNEKIVPENVDRALQYLHKSYRCFAMTSDWEKDVVKCKDIARQMLNLANAYLDVYELQQKAQLLSTIRLQLKGVVARIRQHHTNPITRLLDVELQEPLSTMESVLADVAAKAATALTASNDCHAAAGIPIAH